MSRKWRHQILKRKNFAPTLLIIIALWLSIISLILYTDPNTTGIIHIFFILLFFAIFLTSSVLLVNTKRGFIIAIGSTLFMFMKFIGTGSIRNFLLVVLVFGLIDLYFAYSSKSA